MIGKEIQSYRILQALGEGGMGSVYKAVHKRIPTLFAAVKVLHPGFISHQMIKQKFYQEAAVLAQLSHPNIVRLLDFTEDEHGLYLIMEYVEGRSLDDMIKKETGPIEEQRSKKIFSKILDAFQYAHSQNPSIIHRDIKPSNILIGNTDEPKIIDFGIVKILETGNNVGATQTGTKIGTPLFMSPEQILGRQVDARTDIYSLGVTLFHMITGKSPYLNTLSEFEIQTKIVNEPMPKAKEVYPFASEHIESVIEKATRKAKDQRFESCEAFKDALLSERPYLSGDKVIQYFRADKLKVKQGGEVLLSWSVNTNCSIELQPVGILKKAIGTITVKPDQDITYKLKAENEVSELAVSVVRRKSYAAFLFIIAFFLLIVTVSAIQFISDNMHSKTEPLSESEYITTDTMSTVSIVTDTSTATTDTMTVVDETAQEQVSIEQLYTNDNDENMNNDIVTTSQQDSRIGQSMSYDQQQALINVIRKFYEQDNKGGSWSNVEKIVDFFHFPVNQYYSKTNLWRTDLLRELVEEYNIQLDHHSMRVDWDYCKFEKLSDNTYRAKIKGFYDFREKGGSDKTIYVTDIILLNERLDITAIYRE